MKKLFMFLCLLFPFAIFSQDCPKNISLKNQGAKEIQLYIDLGNLGFVQNVDDTNISITISENITIVNCNGNFPKWLNSDSTNTNEKLKYASCLGNFCDYNELNVTITQNIPFKQITCKFDRINFVDDCEGFVLPINLTNFYQKNENILIFDLFGENIEFIELLGSNNGIDFDCIEQIFEGNSFYHDNQYKYFKIRVYFINSSEIYESKIYKNLYYEKYTHKSFMVLNDLYLLIEKFPNLEIYSINGQILKIDSLVNNNIYILNISEKNIRKSFILR